MRDIKWGVWQLSNQAYAHFFDWVNDDLTSNSVIWRTWVNLNVSGNVSVGSDADGTYLHFNGNRDWVASSWTMADASWTVSYNQGTSFTIKVRAKVNAYAPNWVSGLFGWSNQAAINYTTTNQLTFWLRGSTTVSATYNNAFTLWTVFDAYIVYNASEQKFYNYIGSSLQNAWWTTWPTTFTFSSLRFEDWCVSWVRSSSSKYIYHAAIWNVALTPAEIAADVALGNAVKTDSRIVNYYIPDNLQYNTQYLSNPTSLDNATWTKGSNTTVTADYATAPDWTVTADRVVRTWVWWLTNNKVDRTFTTISGAQMASKTFIVKAFVRAVSWSPVFGLRCTHGWVADYYSSDLTATSTRQEFTFTQTFTSSTSGTWITAWLVVWSWLTAVDLEVWNVRCFLNNEVLWDECSNIGWFIWRKTPRIISSRYKPDSDSVETSDGWVIVMIPYLYCQDRWLGHVLQARVDTSLVARTAFYTLWTSYRGAVRFTAACFPNGSWFTVALWVNWVAQPTVTFNAIPSTIYTPNLLMWRKGSTYHKQFIWNTKVLTFTWTSLTDTQVQQIENWIIPAWFTLHTHYWPFVSDTWTTVLDGSWNNRTWTLNNWATRQFTSLV